MNIEGTPSKLSPRKSLQRQRRAREYTSADVEQLLDSTLISGQNMAQMVRQIFEECQSESNEGVRKTVFQHCIEQLNMDRLQSQMAKELVGKLLIEVDSLMGPSLVELAELLIKGVKEGKVANGRSLELFPKILSAVAAQTSIRYQKDGGGCGEMEGAEYRSHLLNSLCSCRWAPSSVLHVTNMCREIPMTSDELQFLMEKILRMMQSLGLSELPPLVYQLLVLSTKGHKTLVLEGIRLLFNQLDEKILSVEQQGEDVVAGGQDELLQTEGTVILHVTFALKQDQELGREFVKNLKAVQSRVSTSLLSPFSVALCLSVARIHRFEEPVFDFLKAVILKSFKDEERRVASKWMQEVYQDAPDMEKLVLDTVQHSVCGWDHVVQGLIIVGFNLMDSFAPKSTTPSFGTPQYRTCCLGSKILLNSFKVHHIVHQEVISQLINRILTNASSYVSHYIELLSDLVGTSPQVALDSVSQLREAFSYLALLPPSPALELLQAILPLVQYSASVRDSLLLVLRKSLFSRQIQARKIAVGGYLLLLRKFRVLDSVGVDGSQASQLSSTGSQVTVEIHSTEGPSGAQSGYEALCLEILGTLRRSLAQQCEVRTTLYEGLYEVFCGNPKLAEPILDMLINQFQRYYELDPDVTPPVKLEPCLAASGSEVHRTEPLDHLVQCLQLCVSRFVEGCGDRGEEVEVPGVVGEAQDILQSLVERMVKSEPEDFELDKSADFSSSSSVGQRNRLFAKMVMHLYETLLEYAFMVGEFSQESCEQVLKLHHGYQRVADIFSEKTSAVAGAKRGPGGSSPSRMEPSALSLRAVVQLLRAVFSDAIPGHQQSLTVLRDSQMFVRYLVTAALQKIHQIHEKGTCDGLIHHHKAEKVFKGCCSLSRVLFKQVGTTGAQKDGGKKEKGKSVPVLCLEGFYQLLQTVSIRYAKKMDTFLTSVNPAIEEDTGRNERVHFFVRHFQRLVTGTLNGSIKDWSMKEVHTMVSTIGLLSSELEVESQQLDQVYEWTQAQCKEQNVDDAQVTKALVSLLLHLNARQKGSVKIIRKLSQDVHYHLGDIDEDVELECRPHFAIVNPRTAASSVLGLIYGHTEQVLNNAEWLIGRLKSDTSTSVEEIFDGVSSFELGTQAEELCSSLCERLMNFVVACHELVQSAVSPGPATEGLLKTVTKLYNVMANLAKYHLSVYFQLSHITPNFRKMIEMVGSHLSQQVYSLINYIQLQSMQAAEQQQQDRGKKGGKGKGKGVSSTGKAKVRKEIRSIPSLIFAMEQLEKFLIQLSKKSKVNLMENFKRSTSRDFRINGQTVEAILNDIEEEEESGESEEDDREDDGVPRPKKLKKT